MQCLRKKRLCQETLVNNALIDKIVIRLIVIAILKLKTLKPRFRSFWWNFADYDIKAIQKLLTALTNQSKRL